jgi:hypothetical protein
MQVTPKKSTKRLFRAIAFIAVLSVAFAASVAYANSVRLLYDHGDGTTVWLSCGSSAGNTIWTCTASGCLSHYDDPGGFNQSLADGQCNNERMDR